MKLKRLRLRQQSRCQDPAQPGGDAYTRDDLLSPEATLLAKPPFFLFGTEVVQFMSQSLRFYANKARTPPAPKSSALNKSARFYAMKALAPPPLKSSSLRSSGKLRAPSIADLDADMKLALEMQQRDFNSIASSAPSRAASPRALSDALLSEGDSLSVCSRDAASTNSMRDPYERLHGVGVSTSALINRDEWNRCSRSLIRTL